MLPPIIGPAWGYRRRARLTVRKVEKKGGVLVGFHERKSRYVADMQVCPVLIPKVSALLMPLRDLVVFPHMVSPIYVGREGSLLARPGEVIIKIPQTQADEASAKSSR